MDSRAAPGCVYGASDDSEGMREPFWQDCNYSYSVFEWVNGCEGRIFPGRTENMTDAEYFRELEEVSKVCHAR